MASRLSPPTSSASRVSSSGQSVRDLEPLGRQLAHAAAFRPGLAERGSARPRTSSRRRERARGPARCRSRPAAAGREPFAARVGGDDARLNSSPPPLLARRRSRRQLGDLFDLFRGQLPAGGGGVGLRPARAWWRRRSPTRPPGGPSSQANASSSMVWPRSAAQPDELLDLVEVLVVERRLRRAGPRPPAGCLPPAPRRACTCRSACPRRAGSRAACRARSCVAGRRHLVLHPALQQAVVVLRRDEAVQVLVSRRPVGVGDLPAGEVGVAEVADLALASRGRRARDSVSSIGVSGSGWCIW